MILQINIFMSLAAKIKILQIINHLMIFPAIYFGQFTWFLGSFVIWYIICIVGVSSGLHRYLSHRSFQTNKIWEAIMLFSSIPATIGSPIGWVGTHRKHHQFSDSLQDPHSPLQLGIIKSQLHQWQSFNIDSNQIKDIMKNKLVVFIHKNYFSILLAYIIVVYTIDPILGIFVYSIPAVFAFHGTGLVNSVCHRYGYRNFETKDQSTNNWLVNLYSPGEGWHNNHHRYPANSNFGHQWWEFDLSYYFVKLITKRTA